MRNWLSANINAQARLCLIRPSRKFATLMPLCLAQSPHRPTSRIIFRPSCGCANRWICMPTCAHADPFHIHPHAQALTCSSSARIPKACTLASSALKMTAIAPSPNESSPAKVRKESSAKHLIWRNKQDAKLFTLFTKPMCLRQTCGLFRTVAFEIAKEYPDITMHEMLVDTCAMELVRAPEQFDVIVTTNLFGDILSDEACMFVGGLGVAASEISAQMRQSLNQSMAARRPWLAQAKRIPLPHSLPLP